MKNNKAFTKIILLNILVFISLSMVHPVTPKLINSIGLPKFYFGLLYAYFSISTFIASPTFGSICDVYGKKFPMILGLLGYTFGQIIFGFFSNHITILIARIISGIFICGYYLSSVSYVSSISNPQQKLKNLAYLNASGSLGSALGSFLGGYVGVNNYKITFIVQFFILITSLTCICLFFKDETAKSKKVKISFKIFSISDFKKISKTNKTIFLILPLVVLTFLGIQSYTSTISYYIEEILNLPTTINGFILGSTGISTILTNLFIIPIASKKLNAKTLFSISSIISGVSIIVAISSRNTIISLLSLLLFIIAHTTIVPITQSIMIEFSSENQGELLGLQNGFRAIGSFLGAIVSGFIFNFWFKLPFFISGASFIICSITLMVYKKINKATINF